MPDQLVEELDAVDAEEINKAQKLGRSRPIARFPPTWRAGPLQIEVERAVSGRRDR